MHGYSEDDHVSRHHFLDQRVRERQRLLLLRRSLGRRCVGRLDPRFGHERQVVRRQVPFNDASFRVLGLPLSAKCAVSRRETELLRGLELMISRVFMVVTS